MGLESATYVDGLTTTNPASGDNVSQGDDHLRLIKSVLKSTFPNATKPFYFPVGAAKSADYTVLASDQNAHVTMDASGAAREFELPLGSGLNSGFLVTLSKIDSGTNEVTVIPNSGGSDTINGASTYSLGTSQWASKTFMWTGAAWITSQFNPVNVPAAKTSDYTVVLSDDRALVQMNATSGDLVVNLPAGSGIFVGFQITIRKTDTSVNFIDIDGNSSDTINGRANFYLQLPLEQVTLTFAGSNAWLASWDYGDKGIGSTSIWRLDTLPNWGLLNNGQTVAKADYPRLDLYFAADSYPYGDSGGNMDLPDDRGRFHRALDESASVDPDAATRTDRGDGTGGDNVGSLQDEDMLAHVHEQQYRSGTYDGDVQGGGGGANTWSGDGTTDTEAYPTSGGNETRPTNIAVRYVTRF